MGQQRIEKSVQSINLPVANREHKSYEATYIEAAYFREWDSLAK